MQPQPLTMVIKSVFRKYLIILSFACQSAEVEMEEINSSVKSIFNENGVEAQKTNYYHKHVMCGACGKWMCDDNLKRHMTIHADLTELKDDDAIIN